MLTFTLSMCVSCFVGDKITFFKGKDGDGSVFFFFLTFFLGKIKCGKLFVDSLKFLEAGP